MIEISDYRVAKKEDGSLTANFKCPDCGRFMSVINHEIGADGQVSPSVVSPYYSAGVQTRCPAPNCNFHEYIKLKNWPKPEREGDGKC